jgi:hypothetical protein
MEKMELEEQLRVLQSRADHLERRQRQFLAGFVLAFVVFILSAWQSKTDQQENIKTRALSIVDKNGVPKIVFGAPVPNPVVDGKTVERRSPATGIIFNNSSGNERGGIGMLDDGSMNLCFDDARTERNCLFLSPKMGNGLVINDANGNGRALLYLDQSNSPHLMLIDEQGHPLVSLPDSSKH